MFACPYIQDQSYAIHIKYDVEYVSIRTLFQPVVEIYYSPDNLSLNFIFSVAGNFP